MRRNEKCNRGIISIGAYNAFACFCETFTAVNANISDAVEDLRETTISNLEDEEFSGYEIANNFLNEMEDLAGFDIAEWCFAFGSAWCKSLVTDFGERQSQTVLEDTLGIDEDSFTVGDLVFGLTSLYEASTFDSAVAKTVGVTSFGTGFLDAVGALLTAE